VLSLPVRFDLEFDVLSAADQSPIAGADVRLLFDNDLGTSSTVLESSTREDGRVAFDSVSGGTYILEVRSARYVSHFEEIQLPGRFEPWLVNGVLDLRYRLLRPLKRVGFELEGFSDWGGAAGFAIGHEAEGEGDFVEFDSSGFAFLEMGDYAVPVEVNLRYPNGDHGIIYLGHDFRDDGIANPIDVSRVNEIEVDVRVPVDVSGALFDSSVFLQASYTGANGDSVQYAVRIEQEGVYSMAAAFSGPLMLGVTKVQAGRQVVWAAREVNVSGGEGDRFVLNVDMLPLEVQCLVGDNEPLAGAHLVVYGVPDRTNWIAGWVTDSEGVVELPRVPGDRLAMACYDSNGMRAIDHPVRLDHPSERVHVYLDTPSVYQVAVLVDGVAAGGIDVLIQGALSRSVEGALVRTGDDGGPLKLALTSESVPIATPQVSEDMWLLEPAMPLSPGFTEIEVLTTGHLVCAKRSRLRGAEALAQEGSVGVWIDEGRTQYTEGEGGFMVRVPVGPYLVQRPDGETVEVLVETGELTVIP